MEALVLVLEYVVCSGVGDGLGFDDDELERDLAELMQPQQAGWLMAILAHVL